MKFSAVTLALIGSVVAIAVQRKDFKHDAGHVGLEIRGALQRTEGKPYYIAKRETTKSGGHSDKKKRTTEPEDTLPTKKRDDSAQNPKANGKDSKGKGKDKKDPKDDARMTKIKFCSEKDFGGQCTEVQAPIHIENFMRDEACLSPGMPKIGSISVPDGVRCELYDNKQCAENPDEDKAFFGISSRDETDTSQYNSLAGPVDISKIIVGFFCVLPNPPSAAHWACREWAMI